MREAAPGPTLGAGGLLPSPSFADSLRVAAKDWWDGIVRWELYVHLAWQTTRQRYAGSVLGPFWVTISMGVFALMLGILFGSIMEVPRETYLPYLTSGIVVWAAIASFVGEACRMFYGNRHLLLSVKLPVGALPMQIMANQLIIFAHNLVAYAVVATLFGIGIGAADLAMALLGLVLLCLNGFWLAIVLAMVCCRFRDISEVMSIVVQIGFYLSPILWRPEQFGAYRWVVELNPFVHFLAVVREPLLGNLPSTLDIAFVVTTAVLGNVAALLAYARYRGRFVFWM